MGFTPEQLKWDHNGLIPAIVQDAASGQVLMLGYMNQESLMRTMETGHTWFFSRSRGRLWHKGEQSGHVQEVEKLETDCDQDAVLVTVRQVGPGACHEGYFSCFHYPVVDVHSPAGTGKAEAPQRTFDPEEVYRTRSR